MKVYKPSTKPFQPIDVEDKKENLVAMFLGLVLGMAGMYMIFIIGYFL